MNIFFWRKKKKNTQDKALMALLVVLLLAVAINILLYQSNSGKNEKLLRLRTDKVNNEATNRPKEDEKNSLSKVNKKDGLSKNDDELNQKIKIAMNVCPVREQQQINGVIAKLGEQDIYIAQGGGTLEENIVKKIKLTPNTLYIKIKKTVDYELLSQKEIVYEDLRTGVSAFVVYALIENEHDIKVPVALIVKYILTENK